MLVSAPTAARAQSAGESPNPSVDQYIESVPGAEGGTPKASGRERRDDVPADVRRRIAEQGGDDAAALEALTRSEQLGAPSGGSAGGDADAGNGGSDSGAAANRSAADAADPSPVDAASTAAGGGATPWLLGLLAVTAIGLGGIALRRRRDV